MQTHGAPSKRQETCLVARVILGVRQEAWVSRCCLQGQKGKSGFTTLQFMQWHRTYSSPSGESTSIVLVCICDQINLWLQIPDCCTWRSTLSPAGTKVLREQSEGNQSIFLALFLPLPKKTFQAYQQAYYTGLSLSFSVLPIFFFRTLGFKGKYTKHFYLLLYLFWPFLAP